MSDSPTPALKTRLDLSIVWPPRSTANLPADISDQVENDTGAKVLSVDPAVHIEMGRQWKYLGTGLATNVSLKEFSGALVGRISAPLATDPIVCEIQTALFMGIGALASRGVNAMPAFKIDWAEANVLLGVEVVFAFTFIDFHYTAFTLNSLPYGASTPGIFPYKLLIGFRMNGAWPLDSRTSREDIHLRPIIGFETVF